MAYPERLGEELGWVGTLGVRPAWRVAGSARHCCGRLRAFLRRGRTRVGLGVDAENVTGAQRLYERVGMRVVRQGDNWVREP